MSMPKIPDINPVINICRDDAINMIITSIAMEELALAHILNAEGEKLQYVLGTLDDRDPGEVTICDIMEVNNSIQKTLRDVIKAEMLLQLKLEDALELDEGRDECQITIAGKKIWRDGNNVAGTRPATVKINLLRDGEAYKSDTIDAKGDGAYSFPCLPVWKDSENKYAYTVDETVIPAGYTKTISGFNVINTALPGEITISGTKTWIDVDKGTRPPVITVKLLQNGVQVQTKPIPSAENTAQFSFDKVPRFDNEGNPFVYTIEENAVPGYKISITDYHITNTLE